MNGTEIWREAERKPRDEKSANLVRIYALVQMMAEAQSTIVKGDHAGTIENLRMVQAHCEKMVAMLAPEQKKTLKLVAA